MSTNGNHEYTFHDLERVEFHVRAANRMRNLQSEKCPIPKEPIDEHDNALAIANAYFDRYLIIYKELRAGRSQHDKVEVVDIDSGTDAQHIAKRFHYDLLDPSDKLELRQMFQQFAIKLFDEQGKPLPQANVVGAIMGLRDNLAKSILYESEKVFDSFLYELNYVGTKFRRSFVPGGIDSRRSDAPDQELRDLTYQEQQAVYEQRLRQAMDHTRPIPIPESSNFIQPPGGDMDTYIVLGGCRFPIHRVASEEYASGQWHLVLKNGQLANATDELRQKIETHLNAGGSINDLAITPTFNANGEPRRIEDYLNVDALGAMGENARNALLKGLKESRERGGKEATGIEPSSPLCMDEDMLTGLRMDGGKKSEYERFNAFLAESKGVTGVGSLADIMKSYRSGRSLEDIGGALERAALLKQVPGSPGTEVELVAKAMPWLKRQLPREQSIAEQFCDKEAKEGQASLGMVMGSTASGKSGGEKLLTFDVRASLDDMRQYADPSYWLVVASNNHNYDYINYTSFGEIARSTITEMAKEKGLSLLMDSTGIPWRGKNEKMAEDFGHSGYKVEVICTSTPLHMGVGTGTEKHWATSLMNLGARLSSEQRAVPLNVVFGKAIDEPIAVQNAQASKAVKRFAMVDSTWDGFPKPVIAFDLEEPVKADKILRLLDERRKGNGAFKDYLQSKDLIPDWVKWPEGKHSNFKVVLNHENGTFRVVIITDTEHLIREQEKGLLNAYHPDPHKRDAEGNRLPARGPEDLLAYTLSYDLSGEYHGPNNRLKLTPGDLEQFRKTDWVEHKPLLVKDTTNIGRMREQSKQVETAISEEARRQQRTGGG